MRKTTLGYHIISVGGNENAAKMAGINTVFTKIVAYSFCGLMSGVGENLFGGSQNTTRAMLMTILARMDGQDVTGGATWYEKAMNWAKQTGVSDGTMPEVNITREQLVTMFYSYAKLKGMDPIPNGMALSKFSDADSISTWASEAVSWAAYSGIISGRSNGTVDPRLGHPCRNGRDAPAVREASGEVKTALRQQNPGGLRAAGVELCGGKPLPPLRGQPPPRGEARGTRELRIAASGLCPSSR